MIAAGTNAKGKVHCIEVGVPSLGEVFNNFETIAQKSCQKVAANKDFQGEFNVVGLSQGGLLARYIAEECEMPGKVRNVLTLGGPHMGVDAIPGCFKGFVCDIANFMAKQIVYSSFAQNWFAPAGYFRNVQRYNDYVKGSTFLPALNNEQLTRGQFSDLKKESFSSINQLMLVMFEQDTVIYPKETAWFQSLAEDGKTVLPLNATTFYQDDYIGVKELNEAGKIQFVSIDGDHLQFSEDDIKNTFIPFLN
jgi:palmitoyl-protein thioesterase